MRDDKNVVFNSSAAKRHYFYLNTSPDTWADHTEMGTSLATVKGPS